jgi:hypothetical protein
MNGRRRKGLNRLSDSVSSSKNKKKVGEVMSSEGLGIGTASQESESSAESALLVASPGEPLVPLAVSGESSSPPSLSMEGDTSSRGSTDWTDSTSSSSSGRGEWMGDEKREASMKVWVPFSWAMVGCTDGGSRFRGTVCHTRRSTRFRGERCVAPGGVHIFVGSGEMHREEDERFRRSCPRKRGGVECAVPEERRAFGLGVGSRGRYGTMPSMVMRGKREEMEKRN